MNHEKIAPFWDHVEELRRALLKSLGVIAFCTGMALIFHNSLLKFLEEGVNQQLIILSPTEGISTLFRLAVWIGVIFSAPIWGFFLFQFAAPALNQSHRGLGLIFFFFSFIFMGAGASLALYITLPIAAKFLKTFNEGIGQNLWALSNYFDFSITLIFAHSIAFEIALILFFLVHFGLIQESFLRKHRRAAYTLIFILAALLTPPDVMSQLLLAIPVLALYEGARIYGKMRNSSD